MRNSRRSATPVGSSLASHDISRRTSMYIWIRRGTVAEANRRHHIRGYFNRDEYRGAAPLNLFGENDEYATRERKTVS
jgi:hypothetical protein